MFEFVYISFNGRIEAQVIHDRPVTGEGKDTLKDSIVQSVKINKQESTWPIDHLMAKYPYKGTNNA